MKYTIILPIKDEEGNIPDLVREIVEVMTPLGKEWELLCVDDGSTDNSLKILKEFQSSLPNLRLIEFERNYGQSSALAAGFREAAGERCITMDSDGQNDPHDIPKLIEAFPGHEMVCGWRTNRRDPFLKRCIGRIANSIRSRVCGDGVHDTGCQLRLYSTEAIRRVPMFHGMHRFIPALLRIDGCRIQEVAVNHRERRSGVSKYNLFNRGFSLVTDMLVVRWMCKRHLRYQIRGRS